MTPATISRPRPRAASRSPATAPPRSGVRERARWLLTLGVLVAVGGAAGARVGRPAAAEHPAHLSYTEVEYDRASGRLQVAMRLIPEDLEQALRWQTGRGVHLGTDEAGQALIADHLRQRFVVVEGDGRRPALEWVGMELTPKDAWLYFEVPLRQGYEGLRLAHDLFFELQADQVHALKFWSDATPTTKATRLNLRFSSEERAFELQAKQAEPLPRSALPLGASPGQPASEPPRPRVEPLLRARFEECLAALPALLFTLPDPAEGPLPDDGHRRLLEALQGEAAGLDPTSLRTQVAVVQLCTGHLDSGLEHLRHNAEAGGVVAALSQLSRTLEEAARWLRDQGRPVHAAQLRRAATLTRLEL